MLAVIIKVPSGTYHEIFQMLSAAAPTFQKFLKSFFSLEQLHPTLKFKFQVPILTITVQCILYHSIHTPIPSNHSLYPNSLCHPTSILLPDSSLACTDLSRITYLLKKQKQTNKTKTSVFFSHLAKIPYSSIQDAKYSPKLPHHTVKPNCTRPCFPYLSLLPQLPCFSVSTHSFLQMPI